MPSTDSPPDEPVALDLLTLAAHLAPEPIPFTLFTAHPDLLPEPLATMAVDPLAFADLTRVLRQRALARITTDSMQLHRLVQAILLSRQARDGIAAITLRLLRQTVPADPWNDLASVAPAAPARPQRHQPCPRVGRRRCRLAT